MRWIYMTLLTGIGTVALWGIFQGRTVLAQDATAAASAAAPALHLESGVLLADGNTLHLLNVPAVFASGESKYYDITCKFAAGADGTIRTDSISAAPSTMVPNLADQFIPGTYVDNEGRLYTLRGPAITVGGRTSWSLQREPIGTKDDQRNVPPFSAAWTTGPVIGSPDIANFEGIKCLPPGFSYGKADGNSPNVSGNQIIGARQIGDSVQVAIFNYQGNQRGLWVEGDVLIVTAYKPPAQ